MIELRWVERTRPYVTYVDGKACLEIDKVLQYRQRLYESLGPFSGYSNKWSDWQDVPTVREG